MKRAIIILTVISALLSCQENKSTARNYSEECDQTLSGLKSPVILIAIEKSLGGHNVVVKDSLGRCVSFGDFGIIGRALGESRHVGDTIK